MQEMRVKKKERGEAPLLYRRRPPRIARTARDTARRRGVLVMVRNAARNRNTAAIITRLKAAASGQGFEVFQCGDVLLEMEELLEVLEGFAIPQAMAGAPVAIWFIAMVPDELL